MKCDKCGANNPDTNKYCGVCGELLVEMEEVKNTPESQVIINEQADNDTKKKLPPPLKKILIVSFSIIGVLVIAAVAFVVFNSLQQSSRSNRFNAELQDTLTAEITATTFTNIEVGGSYASLITITENSEKMNELWNAATTEETKYLSEQIVYSLYAYHCLDYRIKRSELFITYATNKEEYQKDKKFLQAATVTPLCRIISTRGSYEYFENAVGENVFTVDGEPYELLLGTDTESATGESYSYGNPSPVLEELMNKKGVTLNAKEVQYNMANNIGEPFGLEGTAELCDYYNWGYDDSIESRYFCMEVAPYGGDYGDQWYIYSDRDSFSKLYSDLLNSSVDIRLIAQIDSYRFEEGQQNQATLKSASWR